jgi:hypothetical protein
MAAFSQN